MNDTNQTQSNVYVSDGVPTAIQSHNDPSSPNNDFNDPDDEPTVTIPYETLQQANERWLGEIASGIASSERTTRRMKALPKPDRTP